MCFQWFIILLFALWAVHLIRSSLLWYGYRKQADEIIASRYGSPQMTEQLINMFRHKNPLGKRDRARLDELVAIRDMQIKGVKHVESKVRDDKEIGL